MSPSPTSHDLSAGVSGALVAVSGDRAPDVVDVLSEAFFDYPVMRFVIGRDGTGYERALRRLVGLFVAARILRGEPMLGIMGRSGLEAAAIVSRPVGGPAPDAFRALADEVWDDLGTAARARYQAFGRSCAPFRIPEPHLHLNMLGVRAAARGLGLGRQLVEQVQEMSWRDERSVGVTLTTEDPGNVRMYEHLGYRIVGRAIIAPTLQTWGFFRPSRAGSSGASEDVDALHP